MLKYNRLCFYGKEFKNNKEFKLNIKFCKKIILLFIKSLIKSYIKKWKKF